MSSEKGELLMKTCELCRFWFGPFGSSTLREQTGSCSRYPPTAIAVPRDKAKGWSSIDYEIISVLPMTNLSFSCGEFSPKRVQVFWRSLIAGEPRYRLVR